MLKYAFAFLSAIALTQQNTAEARFGGPSRGIGGPPAGGPPPPFDGEQDGGRPEGGPMMGGGPEGGPMGGRPRGPPPRFNATIVDLDCPVVSTDPVCPEDRDGQAGIWVCRQGIDRRSGNETTFSTCTSVNRTLSIDTCGCCGDSCPELCDCPCNLDGTDEEGNALTGVSVVLTLFDDTTETRCMDPRRAFHKLTRGGDRFACDTSCNLV